MFDSKHIKVEIYLDGDLITNHFVSLSVATEVNVIPRARIELNYRQLKKQKANPVELEKASSFDPQPKKIDHDFLPGKEIEIKLGEGNHLQKVFTGRVVRQRLSVKNNGKIILTVECKHEANRMTLHKRTRFFHHDANTGQNANDTIDRVKDLQVIKHLLEESDDYNFNLKVDGTPLKKVPEHENLVQYNCSDWDFLMLRADALGYVVLPKEQQIHFFSPSVKTTPTAKLELGENLMAFEAEYDETVRATENIFQSWDIEKQKVETETLKNKELEQATKSIQSENQTITSTAISTVEKQLYLEGKLNRQQLGFARALVTVKGRVDIAVGSTVELAGFHSVWDRATFVSGVRHELRSGSWLTHLQCGLSTLSHAEKYGLSTSPEQTISSTDGLLFGVVRTYKKSEAGHELLEVEVAGYDGKGDDKRTVYARLATFSAGENGGAVFRPFPGDEVVIGFIQNDTRFPVVLGSVYNGNNTFPFSYEDAETQNLVGFTINDWKLSIDQENKQLVIASPNGQSLLLDDDQEEVQLFYDNQNGITINSDGIELKASEIKLKGTNGIALEGMKIEGKADTGIKLESGTQLDLEGKVTATLKGQITQIN